MNIRIPTERLYEVFSSCLAWVFGLALLIDDRMLTLDIYRGFANKWILVGGFLGTAILATICLMRYNHKNSLFCAGFVLLVEGFVWLLMAIQFMSAWPPLSTGMLSYALMSIFCLIAGYKNIYIARAEEDGTVTH